MSDARDSSRPAEPRDSDLAPVLRFPTARPDAERAPEPRLRDVIGEVLREERLDQERTLADVAESAAVSLPYLSEVERGVKDVSSDLLGSICDALDISLADVLDRSAGHLRATFERGSGVTMLAA